MTVTRIVTYEGPEGAVVSQLKRSWTPGVHQVGDLTITIRQMPMTVPPLINELTAIRYALLSAKHDGGIDWLNDVITRLNRLLETLNPTVE